MKLYRFICVLSLSLSPTFSCDNQNSQSDDFFPTKLSITTQGGEKYQAILEEPKLEGPERYKEYDFHKACVGPVVGFFTWALENTILDGFTQKQVDTAYQKCAEGLKSDLGMETSLLAPYYNWRIFNKENQPIGRLNIRHFAFANFIFINEAQEIGNIADERTILDVLSKENLFYEAGAYIDEPYRKQGIGTAFIASVIDNIPGKVCGRPLQIFAVTEVNNSGTTTLFQKFKDYAACIFISKYYMPAGFNELLPQSVADWLSTIDAQYFFLKRGAREL